LRTKACIVGHSLIDLRQKLFCEELRKQGLDVLEIYPRRWFHQEREGGFDVDFKKGIAGYTFPGEAYRKIKEFSPDLIYSMSELWQAQSPISSYWAKNLGTPVIFFVWDNLCNQPALLSSRDIDLLIAGNKDAAKLHNADVVLPQVGIDPELFRPMPEIEKEYDLVFVGRDTPEKGTQIIREVMEYRQNLKLLWRKEFLDYDQLPAFLNRAKIHLSPSIDTPHWKEQAGNYSNLEALACGLCVITSDSAAIVEWLDGCPTVEFVPQNDVFEFRRRIPSRSIEIAKGRGREWIKARYSNEVVARQLIKAFEEI